MPFGRRAVDWELKGVPVRVEVGPRDLAEDRVMLVRRVPGTKSPVPLGGLVDAVRVALVADQVALYAEAEQRRDERIVDVKTVDDAVEAASAGWARMPWSELGVGGRGAAGRAVGQRALPDPRRTGRCRTAEDEPDLLAYCARAY